MRVPIKRLEASKAFFAREISSLNMFYVLERREQYRKNPPPGLDVIYIYLQIYLFQFKLIFKQPKRCNLIEGDFAALLSFLHGLEMLLHYGIKSFFIFLKSFIEAEHPTGQQSRIRNEMLKDALCNEWFKRMKTAFESVGRPVPNNMRHPKLVKLQELVLEHFNNHKDSN